ncbi:MAG: T9SS type A sorting domain-containing protein [Ignavibacteria bacterium]|nr:T9SS type A sorting domain-containing protein [Ignavibacteria bacterium]
MKKNYFVLFLFFSFLFTVQHISAQTFDGVWQCSYATWDNAEANATGTNTVNVAAVRENTFFALIGSLSRAIAFPIGYRDATDSTGRLGYVPYSPYPAPFVKDSLEVYWTNPDNGFDYISAKRTLGIAATPDSLAYITSNDDAHNILVFKMGTDSVYSTPYRLETGTERIHGITVDDNGYVFTTTYGADDALASVRVYKGIKDDPSWGDPHTASPVQTFVLPDIGRALDIAVNGDASLLYVANYTARKVYLYTGSPATGYTIHNNFNFAVTDSQLSDGAKGGPTGLAFLKKYNLLFVSVDNYGSGTYDMGRFYIVNPNTGEKLDTCDIAQWNLETFGVTNNRTNDGKFPTGSGYTSVYGIDVDASGNIYTPSYNGWSIEKWAYTGQLPTISITVLGVERVEGMNPSTFTMAQNYPNPFNPSTTIEFGISQQSKITLKIYDINGALVTTLLHEADLTQGTYKVSFDASKLASGTYVYNISNGTTQLTNKMIFLK